MILGFSTAQGKCLNTVYSLEDHKMYAASKHLKMSKKSIIHLLVLASVSLPASRQIFASEEMSDKAGAMVLVLEDCDRRNETSTYIPLDNVSLLNPKGKLVRKFYGLNITSTIKGCKKISASQDGRFFVICENMPDRLSMYETATRKKLWSLWMDFNSAVFAKDLIYAVNRNNLFAIEDKGTIVKHSRLGGFDIAVDPDHNCLWIVGSDIKKCNLNFQMLFKTELELGLHYNTGAFSVEVNSDGSVWIAEQNVYEENDDKNQLVKRSLDGSLQKIIGLDFSPIRVRIDRSDGSVWTTGIIKERDFSGIGDEMPDTLDELNKMVKTNTGAFARKYDSEGNLIFEICEGGYSIELDQSDGSAWIAGGKNIWHYSAGGQLLAVYPGSSDCQKWLAIIPGTKQKRIAGH